MKSQKEFFNRVANSWDEMCNHDMKKVESILDLVGIQEGSRVLDVGTGTGVLIPSLSQRVTQLGGVKAIDVAEKMIEVAQQKNKYENVDFECGDVLETNGDEDCYDHIICYSMFPHFQRKEKAIEKLSQKLKVGGKLTICHSQSRKAINNLHKRADDSVKEDNLPAIEIVRQYYIGAGMNVIKEVDDEEMFVIIGNRFGS
ncbi:class I SAM-dependent methyltransferase [Alkaliphilus peptidifermentans]|uniref:Demethylmenaquinone methyltransferase / 2-methoxy-6-polyprenyl-1,4-benzoquinol methylase n=1 Tax=Alkaliphilus peptidifermentans DSM 18978 TaxID=1120976 RepID=A0A1G5IJF3_9FIRM|nr:class I SAM-dependent methyltransferase [Alkaliphilus peptidifermentans]SCY76216.1 demethylmenaquinone methyltransferase / 2-methoxy-6-polyprenyl-1,4-benzoquinol methylase [Alkaliphilus peptidifermentans DSM 18978]